MKIFFYLTILSLFSISCNPKLHIEGAAMRHHNLSQNKYQPNKHRKKVKIGDSPNSLFWFIKRKN